MKVSEKLKKQIDEAKGIAEKSNAEVQGLADGADIEPPKAIAAIEKAQGKARAAELVISRLESKLAAALHEEDRQEYNVRVKTAEKAISLYVESLSVPYRQLREALTLWEEGTTAIAAARGKVYAEIKGMYEGGAPYHDSNLDALLAQPSLDWLKYNNMDYLYQRGDKGFSEMRKRIDSILEAKKADGVLARIRGEWEPFEREPPFVHAVQEPNPILVQSA
jgi:hypothetical protein